MSRTKEYLDRVDQDTRRAELEAQFEFFKPREVESDERDNSSQSLKSEEQHNEQEQQHGETESR